MRTERSDASPHSETVAAKKNKLIEQSDEDEEWFLLGIGRLNIKQVSRSLKEKKSDLQQKKDKDVKLMRLRLSDCFS